MSNRVSVDFVANTGTFETDVKRAARTAHTSMQEVSAATIAIGVAMGNALIGAAEKLTSAVEQVISTGAQIEKMSQKTGLSTEALSALRVAAVETGQDFDRLGKVVTKVAGIQFDAASGNKKATAEMKAFGITLKDTADTALDKLLKGFGALPANFDRAGLAVKIFGQRLGTDFLLIADQTQNGLKGLEDHTDALGLLMDGPTAKAAEDFEKNLADLKLIIEGLAEKIFERLAPALIEITEGMKEAGKHADFADTIATGLGLVADAAIVADATIRGVVSDVIALGKAGDALSNLSPYRAFGKLVTGGSPLKDFHAGMAGANDSHDMAAQQSGRIGNVFSGTTAAVAATHAPVSMTENGATPDSMLRLTDAQVAAQAKMVESLKTLHAELEKGATAHGHHAKKVKEDMTAVDDLWKELEKQRKAGIAASDDVTSVLNEQEAALRRRAELIGGPLLVASNKYKDVLEQLAADERAMFWADSLSEKELARLTQARKQAAAELKKVQDDLDNAIKQQADWRNGLKDALKDYVAQARDVAGMTHDAVVNAFQGMEDALVKFVTTGKLNFKQLAISILADLARIEIKILLSKVLQSLFGGFGGDTGSGPSSAIAANGYASGATFSGGNVIPFASGGVVNGPTLFPMANGMGLMGEAGPEAVMPLSRGADGKLGVKASGGMGGDVNITVVMNSDGSQNSKTQGGDQQQGRQLGEAIKAVVVRELVNQQRQGGMLWKQAAA